MKNRAYLYQWTRLESDFHSPADLLRKGANGPAAGYLRGIESDSKNSPSTNHWLVCARRVNGVWRVDALLLVRPTMPDEEGRAGAFEKYVYIDSCQSGFMTIDGSSGIVDQKISDAIRKRVPGQTEGKNGVEIPVTESDIERLKSEIKLNIAERIAQIDEDALRKNIADTSITMRECESEVPSDMEGGQDKGQPGISLREEVEIDVELELGQFDEQVKELTGFDIDVLAKRRFGQGIFRQMLIEDQGSACSMSGISMPDLLIASHIVPWSKSNPVQRLDKNNGLLLSVSWDAMFDKGLVAFDDDGGIMCAETLSSEIATIFGVFRGAKLPKRLLTDERKRNLAWHRDNVFRDNLNR